MDKQDDFDAACWAQQEQDERRLREDEALERHRHLRNEFLRERSAFERDTADWHARILNLT